MWTSGIDTGDLTELDSAILDCTQKAEHKLERCPGQGGEGGGGVGGQ